MKPSLMRCAVVMIRLCAAWRKKFLDRVHIQCAVELSVFAKALILLTLLTRLGDPVAKTMMPEPEVRAVSKRDVHFVYRVFGGNTNWAWLRTRVSTLPKCLK